MTCSTLINEENHDRSTKSTKIKKSSGGKTSIIITLLLLVTKFQHLIKQCLTNTIVYTSVIHFSIFYLISIVMGFVMATEEEDQKKMNCQCFVKRQRVLRVKELQYYYDKMHNRLLRIIKADQPLRIKDTVDFARLPQFLIKFFNKFDFGVGYVLSDYSICVAFFDKTSLLMSHPDDTNLRYIDWNYEETFLTFNSYPKELEEKVEVMLDFADLMKMLPNLPMKAQNKLSDLPHVLTLTILERSKLFCQLM